ncbi:Retrovirus-related Pol polyprotein from transposon gypsy [Nosema granulosis]|uniref:Retrovirus-related Pol polyprotein from transposon gypsy n=1 Tax=Nosema granulosis TaxID=83296 RepID=A0A9P6KWZ7_9MICR|nr:Retrovirus-related Pol polyprotein from transposon gypsy [Nosema granulosis]
MWNTIREELKEEENRRRREVNFNNNYVHRRAARECFVCGKVGHIARFCDLKKGEESRERYNNNNNKTFEYLVVDKQEATERVDELVGGRKHKRLRSGLELDRVIEMYPEVLKASKDKIVYKTGVKCYIRTPKGEKIVRRGQIVPRSMRVKTKTYFQDLEERGIIRKSRSDWRNPIRAIEKPNGDVRVVSNLMGLNDLVEKDPYTLPTIREVILATQGSTKFSVVDLKEGFYHIEIEENHKHKTAFEFDGMVYEWNSMVMGFKNSPQIMQKTMNGILEEFRGKGVEVYMDDVVIHAKDGTKHDDLFLGVMQRFKEAGLKVNPGKIQYRKDEVELLGVTIDGYSRKPSEITKNEALEYKRPECVKDVRRFLGLAGWFRDFIRNFALITINLTEALKTKSKWKWTEEMEEEFKLVKEELRNMRPLKIPDYKEDFRLRTDACDSGLGAVLLQKNKRGE